MKDQKISKLDDERMIAILNYAMHSSNLKNKVAYIRGSIKNTRNYIHTKEYGKVPGIETTLKFDPIENYKRFKNKIFASAFDVSTKKFDSLLYNFFKKSWDIEDRISYSESEHRTAAFNDLVYYLSKDIQRPPT